MATIGVFEATSDGYEGIIRTLTLKAKVRIVPNEKKNGEKSPDYFVKADTCDIGAAWRATSTGKEPVEFLSVILDDPSFAAPIRAALFDKEGKANLAWDRK